MTSCTDTHAHISQPWYGKLKCHQVKQTPPTKQYRPKKHKHK